MMDDLFHHKSRDEGYCRMTWSTLGRKNSFFELGSVFVLLLNKPYLGWVVEMTNIFWDGLKPPSSQILSAGLKSTMFMKSLEKCEKSQILYVREKRISAE